MTPPWRPLLEAQLSAHPRHNVYALATIAADGAPKVRHLVHRASLLVATTDARSPKASQMATSPRVEAAWFIQPSMVQFRISGSAFTYPGPTSSSGAAEQTVASLLAAQHISGPETATSWWDAERERLWSQVPPPVRASFAKPVVPGARLADGPDPKEWPTAVPMDESGVSDDVAKTIAFARDNFALVAIVPDAVEMLELETRPHRRTTWRRETGWEREEIVP